MILRLDHVGLATDDPGGVGGFLSTLGLRKYDEGHADDYGVACEFWQFAGGLGNPAVEVVSPSRERSEISGRLERQGPGLYHLAFEVDDLDSERTRLRGEGWKAVDATPCGEPARACGWRSCTPRTPPTSWSSWCTTPRRPGARMITLDDVRAAALHLPRTQEHLIREYVKFRVGRIVYASVSPDETAMGFAFPREERELLIASEPEKYQLPRTSDLRYNWVQLRMAAFAPEELGPLVVDAWLMAVPRSVGEAYLDSLTAEG
ncbi:VOC family protein [Streptomyces sp. AD16]|nr:VOC family protein [Streptomyces sp. AD16]